MKKIFYITSRAPVSYAGREYMIKQNIEFLTGMGYSIELFFLDNNKIEHIDNVSVIHQFPRPSIKSIIKNSLFLTGKSFQERLFYSQEGKKYIKKYLAEHSFDFVLVDMVRMAYLVENYKGKKLLEYDDLLSMRYQRMSEQFNDKINLLGTYSEKYPLFITSLIKPFRKIVLGLESKLIGVREIELAKKFDAISFTSPVEAEVFSKRSGIDIVYYNPPAVDIKLPKMKIGPDKASFCLLGNMKANHNLASLQEVVKIFNHEIMLEKNISISIYGDYDERAVEICKTAPNVHLKGAVSSVSEVFETANCLVAPIPFGSGIKVKIIEAMNYGALVVTNDIGAEGIGLTANKNFIKCTSIEEFRNKLISINNDLIRYSEIAGKGCEYIRNNFSYEVVQNNLRSMFN